MIGQQNVETHGGYRDIRINRYDLAPQHYENPVKPELASLGNI
jgi:hypothetical protein